MKGTCLLTFLLILELVVEGKVYTRCGLTQELLNNGFSRTLVGNCKYIKQSLFSHMKMFENSVCYMIKIYKYVFLYYIISI